MLEANVGYRYGAAADLQLPISTITRILTRMEKNLDLLLVRRSQRGFALTDAGRELRADQSFVRSGCEIIAYERQCNAMLLGDRDRLQKSFANAGR
jgi:Bacterial regulatory helix-turn-helix protein, lysR family